MSELKCCPFCGGEAIIEEEDVRDIHGYVIGKRYALQCDGVPNCSIYPRTCGTVKKEDAINLWNTRKPMDNIVEKLEKREKYLENAMKESHEKGYCFSEAKAMNERVAIRYAINIIKQEINNGLE